MALGESKAHLADVSTGRRGTPLTDRRQNSYPILTVYRVRDERARGDKSMRRYLIPFAVGLMLGLGTVPQPTNTHGPDGSRVTTGLAVQSKS
jgi:hypothetical protein